MMMLRIIHEAPGLTTSQLGARLLIGADSADYHARRLAKSGLIIRECTTRGTYHYAQGCAGSREARCFARLPPSVHEALRLVECEPGAAFNELKLMTTLRPGGLRWALARAHGLGLIEVRRRLSKHYFSLSPAGTELLEPVRAAAAAPLAALDKEGG